MRGRNRLYDQRISGAGFRTGDQYIVKEAFWSRGIGRRLINEAKKHSRSLELKVYEKNQRALEFYKKWGLL